MHPRPRPRPRRRRRAPVPVDGGAGARPTAAGRGGAVTAQAAPSLACYGDGTSGYRVQVIFARASDVADRFAALQSSLVQWSAAAETVVSASAAETGGVRHIRFVTGAGCALSIARVTLPPAGDDTFGATIDELVAQGYDRTDRKYLVYVDANVYCGIGEMYFDDRATTTPGVNYNNGHPRRPGHRGPGRQRLLGPPELGRGPRADAQPGRRPGHRPPRTPPTPTAPTTTTACVTRTGPAWS